MRLLRWLVIAVLLVLGFSGSSDHNVYAADTIRVSQQTPGPGATKVDTMSQIIVAFDHPVIALTGTDATHAALTPIEIAPVVAGQGEWVNTFLYVFTPTAPMLPGTTYRVTIPENLTAADGAAIQSESWTFTIGALRAYGLTAGSLSEAGYRQRRLENDTHGVLLDDVFQVTFSQSVPQAVGEQLIHVLGPDGEEIDGEFIWREPSARHDQEVVFRPANQLAINSAYTIMVAAMWQEQQILEEAVSYTFYTVPLPSVSSVSPEDGSQLPINNFRDVTIKFASPMNTETLRDRILVEPQTVEWEPVVLSDQQLQLDFEPEEGIVYHVTLLAGTEDIYGNPIETDYTWSFSYSPEQERKPNDTAYLAVNGNFTLLSAGRTPTRLAMVATGDVDLPVSFDLYDIVPEDLANVIMTRYNAWTNQSDEAETYEPPAFEDEAHLMRSWSQVVNGNGDRNTYEIVLNEAALPPGLYWLRADEFAWDYKTEQPKRVDRRLLVSVTNVTLTVKRTEDEVLVLVTDMVTGAPLSGVTIRAYRDGTSEATGMTNSNGIAHLPVTSPSSEKAQSEWYVSTPEYLLITATHETTFGAWYSDQVVEGSDTRGYLYTDRPIYRPGETVYFRGVLRDQDDVTYTPAHVAEVEVSLLKYYNYDEESPDTVRLPVSYFGTFHGSFDLPEDAPPGRYNLSVDWGDSAFTMVDCQGSTNGGNIWCYPWRRDGIQFTVANYETPEYEVHVTAQQAEAIGGDDYRVQIAADYYSGGGVAQAETTWSWHTEPTRFTYADYAFTPIYNTRHGYGLYFDGQSETDDAVSLQIGPDGSVLVEGQAPLPGKPVPLVMQFTGTVRQGNDTQTAFTTFIIHPAAVYVGQRSTTRVYLDGEPVVVDLVAVTPNKVPVANQPVTMSVEHITWERQPIDGAYGRYQWSEQVTPIMTEDIVLDATGSGRFTFQPAVGGAYRIHATTTDAEGRSHTSTIRVYVRGGLLRDSENYDDTLAIIADRDSYQPGDTARLLIPTPFAGTLLLTVERADIMYTDVIAVTGDGSILYELPVTYAYAPNVTISATLIGPGVHGHAEYVTAQSEINVDFPHRRLTVEITPSATEVQPGDTVTFDVRVTDQRGRPIRAEVGLVLVDEAVLSLRPPNTESLAETFYSPQRHAVITGYALDGLADDLTDKVIVSDGAGGGGGMDYGLDVNIDSRINFVTTPLWAPAVITDEDGRASVEVTIPDNLTRWRVDARVVSLDTLVGQYETHIVSSQELIVRPQTPRFLLAGDRFEVSAIVQNNTDVDQTLSVWLESTGLDVQADLTQTITVPKQGQVLVNWEAVTQPVEQVEVTVYAANDHVQDAAGPTLGSIPVSVYSVRDTSATGGVLPDAGQIVETVRVPEQALTGTLDLTVSASLVQTTFAALNSYPPQRYETPDVTVGRLLMNTAAYRALRYRPGTDTALENDLHQAIETDIMSLLGQTKFVRQSESLVEVGWAWLPQFAVDTHLTAHTLLVLMEAQRSGFAVEGLSETIDRGCAWMTVLGSLSVRESWADESLDRQSLVTYTIAQCGSPKSLVDTIVELYAYESRMRTSSRAYLLLALQRVQPDHPLLDTMVDNLLGEAVITANGVYWEDVAPSVYSSNLSATALVLRSLVRVAPDTPLLPNIVRWLVMAREGTVWPTALETGWSLAALTEYVAQTGETFPSYSYRVTAGDNTHTEGAAWSSAAGERLLIPFDSGETETVGITRGTGDGALYYTATLDLTMPVEAVEPVARGISIMREYLDADGQALDELRPGEDVFVRLTFAVAQDVYFFQLEDPLPAAFVADDPALLGLAESGVRTARGLSTSDRRWFWGMRMQQTLYLDDRVVLRASHVPPGIYTFSYQARVAAVGTFQAAPPYAFSTQMPDIFGRGAGQIVQVRR